MEGWPRIQVIPAQQQHHVFEAFLLELFCSNKMTSLPINFLVSLKFSLKKCFLMLIQIKPGSSYTSEDGLNMLRYDSHGLDLMTLFGRITSVFWKKKPQFRSLNDDFLVLVDVLKKANCLQMLDNQIAICFLKPGERFQFLLQTYILPF